MHDTIQYIETFDVALLTETRSASYEVFQSYKHFSLPVTDSSKAGQGVCVLVHPRFQKAVSLWKLQPGASAVWVRFSASAFGLDKYLFMASVYIPPAALSSYITHLLQLVSSFCQMQLQMLSSMDMLFLGAISMPRLPAAVTFLAQIWIF